MIEFNHIKKKIGINKIYFSIIFFFITLCIYQTVKEVKNINHLYQVQFFPTLDNYRYSENKEIIDNYILNEIQSNSIKEFFNNKNLKIFEKINFKKDIKFYRAIGSEQNERTIVLKTKLINKDYEFFLNSLIEYLSEGLSHMIVKLNKDQHDENIKELKELILSHNIGYSKKFVVYKRNKNSTNLILDKSANSKVIGIIDKNNNFKFLPYEPKFSLFKIGDVNLYKSDGINFEKIIKIFIMHFTTLTIILFLIFNIYHESNRKKKFK